MNILSIIAGLFGSVATTEDEQTVRDQDRARRYQECAVGGWRFWAYDPPPRHEMVETKMLMSDDISVVLPFDMHPATNICDRLWRYPAPMKDITPHGGALSIVQDGDVTS